MLQRLYHSPTWARGPSACEKTSVVAVRHRPRRRSRRRELNAEKCMAHSHTAVLRRHGLVTWGGRGVPTAPGALCPIKLKITCAA